MSKPVFAAGLSDLQKLILRLCLRSGQITNYVVRAVYHGHHRPVAHVAVSKSLTRLISRGLVDFDPGPHPVFYLTEAGLFAAKVLAKSTRLFEASHVDSAAIGG